MASLRLVSIASRHPQLRLNRRSLLRLIHALDAGFQLLPGDHAQLSRRPPGANPTHPASALAPTGELSLVFLTDPALAQIHADFMDDPSATDVITFEGDALARQAGEICVSVDTAARYARAHRRDFSTELALYVIHGWLHLAGFDDLRPARKRVMRRAEQRALALVGRHLDLTSLFQLSRR